MPPKSQFCKNGHDRTLPDAVDKGGHCRKCAEGRNTRIPAVYKVGGQPTATQYKRNPAASVRDHLITDDLLQHMPLVEVAKKHGVAVSTVTNARNRVLAEMRANVTDTFEMSLARYHRTIRQAEEKFTEPVFKVAANGTVPRHPDTGEPLMEPADPEWLRVKNQAEAGIRALMGWDAPKKTVSATVRDVDSLIREKLAKLNTHYTAEIVDAEIVEE